MRRLLILVALGGLVLPIAACSEDDAGKDTDKAGDDPTSVITNGKKTDKRLVAKTTTCDAQVRTTGSYEAEWTGKAQVRTGGHRVDASGPAAVYTLEDEENAVALFSPGKEFTGSISLFADGLSYTSDPADAGSFDIDEHGRKASVDTTLTSVSGSEIGLVAEFTCGETEK